MGSLAGGPSPFIHKSGLARYARAMDRSGPPLSDRLKGAIGALILQGLLGLALFLGLAGPPLRRIAEPTLTVTNIAAPEPPAPRRAVAPRPAAPAAPPARRARATPVVAPPPIVVVPTPPLVIAAPLPAFAADATAGAAPDPGPGSGAAGVGEGPGSGGAGAGDGGGGTPSRWVRGRIGDGDYPRAAIAAMIEGSLVTRYEIDRRGRVTGCTVTRSSGNPLLDETTCRLVRQRYRYEPARDATGRAIADTVIQNHRWVIVPPGAEAGDEPEP